MKQSQNKQVYDHLMKGNGISSLVAFKMYGITRLAARIKNLRDEGHEIYGKMVEHADRRYKLYYSKESNLFSIYGKSY